MNDIQQYRQEVGQAVKQDDALRDVAQFNFSAQYLRTLELQNRLQIRSAICMFLVVALGFSIFCCFALILLNGFHLWGFQIDASLLKWLCGATIAQVAVLLGVFVRAVWQKSER